MRNSFNLLLVALACFDNVYLLGGVLEAVHRRDTIQLNIKGSLMDISAEIK